MSVSPGEHPDADAISTALVERTALNERAIANAAARVTNAELERAERAVALVFATMIEDPSLREALTAGAAAGAAPRAELPLCRDVVLSIDTALGLAEFEDDPND